ncbi:hypothetical protein [Phytobacter sp. RSE-02]|uniref:hypothetical protein n=1 Tax=Phytobacter sp. RSE-02 TaxID=3229229 RepID=UPI00339D4CBA
MENEDSIIGRALFEILHSGSTLPISRSMLIEHLTQKYNLIYKTSDSVEEIQLYEAALQKVIKKFR